MNNILYAVGIIILLILFLVVVLTIGTRSVESNLLTGFWKADADFCQQSGIDVLLIYIGDPKSGSRPGYIVMQNSDGLIINNPVEFVLSGGTSIKPGLCDVRIYDVFIDWLDVDPNDYDFFPCEQSLYYYPDCGKLVFTTSNQVHAVVYKDGSLSDVSRKMPEETMLANEDIDD